MENMYAEATAKRINTPKAIALRVLVIFAVLFTFFFASLTGSKILFVAGIIMAFLVVWFWPRFNIEWEYIFVDGQLDFDTISGGERRKTRLRIDFDEVEVVAPLKSHALDAYRHYKVRDYSSLRKDANIYVVVAKVGEEGLNQIYFEPNEKMVEKMKNKAPRKVMVI
ncbi:MAG: hypothetical protein E7267_07620 [Lachnospiraceae bacterium]|nr:hypothetical protein [Lachnospiraceae bacterium]